MKSVWFGAAVAALATVIGCDNTSSTPPSSTSSTTPANRGVMGTNTGTSTNPAPATPGTPPTAWDTAAESARTALAAAGAKIDALAARAQTATGEAKTKIENAVKDLRDQSTGIDARISELRQNASNKWEEIRDDVSQRLAELNRKIDDAMTPP